MTSIPPFAAGSYAVSQNASDLLALASQIKTLSAQLSTGRVTETHGELGIGRSDSLSARATLSALGGYDAAIASVRPRVELTSVSLTQISKSAATLRGGLTNNSMDSLSNTGLARAGLDSAIDALNQQFGGQYLFGGRESRVRPVLSADVLLSGDASDPTRPLAGLKTLVAEQIKADQGAGAGRLILSNPTPTSILVREDADAGARANFGFMLAGAPAASGAFATIGYDPAVLEGAIPRFAQAPTATDHFRVVVNEAGGGQKTYDLTGAHLADVSSAASAASSLLALVGGGKIASVQSGTPPGLTASFANVSAPASFAINVATQPASGDWISIKLAMHDGSATTLNLRAQSSADPDSTTDFAIGATPAATALNLSATLQRALRRASETTLAASSTIRATQDFFAGAMAPGLAPRRIDFSGPTPAYFQTPSSSTVIWYKGEASAIDPRSSFVVRAGATRTVGIGARANEDSIRAALSGFAALAASDMSPATTASADRWKALAARSGSLLPSKETLEALSNEFDLASSALSEAQAQDKFARAILQSHLDHVENASMEEVMVKLVDLQNRLQASYQVTSMLSKLSLVNYLR